MTQTYVVPISNADYNRIVQGLVTQCAARAPFCAQPIKPGQPPPIFYYNRPSICVVNCPLDGLPFSYTVPAGIVIGFSQAKADKAAESLACSLAKIHRICLSSLPKFCCSGVAYSKTITATGVFLAKPGQFNFWQVSGNLPIGLTFNGGSTQSATVSITGTPTTPGSYSFTVTVTDPSGDIMTKTYTICVIGITSVPAGSDSSHVPNATNGTDYSATLTVNSCASTFGLHFSLDVNDLPNGLDFDPVTGVISGNPDDVDGDYPFTVTLLNAAGQTVCTKDFTLTLGPALTVTAYWTCDSVAPISFDLVDSVTALHLFYISGIPNPTPPGLISNGIQRTDAFNASFDSNVTTRLAYPDTGGWSLFGWVKINSQGPCAAGPQLNLNTGGGSLTFEAVNPGTNNKIHIFWSDNNHQQNDLYFARSTAVWIFFHVFYDPVAQKIGISLNNGAATLDGVAVSFVPTVNGEFNFNGPNASIANDVIFDELGIKLDRKLTSAEQTFLYNSGAGRTWPL